MPECFGKRLQIKVSFALEMYSHFVAVVVFHLDYTFGGIRGADKSMKMKSCAGIVLQVLGVSGDFFTRSLRSE